MKWFKHDAIANMDAKLQSVILEYGMEGYGLYWYCLELIANNVTPENITFELEHDSRIIARNTGLGAQKVQEIMGHFINLGLFEESSGTITCLKLARRADDYTRKITSTQVIELQQVLETPTKSDNVRESPPRIDKIRLDKNTSNGRFTPPTLSQVQAYAKERNSTVDPQRFIDFYESKGWMVGKNKMKSWEAAFRNWESRDKCDPDEAKKEQRREHENDELARKKGFRNWDHLCQVQKIGRYA